MVERKPSRYYTRCIVPNHPFKDSQNTVLEHRLVMEEWLRIHDSKHPSLVNIKGILYLKPEWIIHHINGQRDDNRIENLKIMKSSDHASCHVCGPKNANWKGGKYTQNGYIYLLQPEHPFAKNRYISEHRFVMEQWIRDHFPLHPSLVDIEGIKYLRPDWRVGYLNKQNKENKIENLKLMDGRHFYSVVSGKLRLYRSKKPDKDISRTISGDIPLSPINYEIYFMLIKKYMNQSQIAKELKLSRQTINEHVQRLELLNLIEPISKKANPKSYKATPVKPYPSKNMGRRYVPVICKETKEKIRRESKSPHLVRNRQSGKIKGWRRPRVIDRARDYDSLVTINGQRVPVLRFHSIVYSCSIKSKPMRRVPWTRVGARRGMKQWIYKVALPNETSKLPSLKKLNITFVRQKTKSSDELIIYTPEKYLFKYELEQAEKILTEYVREIRRWFQKTFQVELGLLHQYRDKSIAREITDPAMKAFVLENGPISIKTKRGTIIADESKKGYPEIEFPSVELVKADLEMPERILSLEQQMILLMEQQRKTMEMIREMTEEQRKLIESQKEFTREMGEFMGFRRKMEKRLAKENTTMFS